MVRQFVNRAAAITMSPYRGGALIETMRAIGVHVVYQQLARNVFNQQIFASRNWIFDVSHFDTSLVDDVSQRHFLKHLLSYFRCFSARALYHLRPCQCSMQRAYDALRMPTCCNRVRQQLQCSLARRQPSGSPLRSRRVMRDGHQPNRHRFHSSRPAELLDGEVSGLEAARRAQRQCLGEWRNLPLASRTAYSSE